MGKKIKQKESLQERLRSYLSFLRIRRYIEEDHASARPVTAEEWVSLFNSMARLADKFQVMFGDVRDAFIRHIEGVVTLPQDDEDLEGRHGFKVDDFHAAWHYIDGVWHKLDFSGVEAQPMIDMPIIQPDEYPDIYDDFYAADAHVVRLIYLMLLDLADRVDGIELRMIQMGDELTILEELVDNFLPGEFEKEWLGFMNSVVYYVQPTKPADTELYRWRNYRAVWIDSNWIK